MKTKLLLVLLLAIVAFSPCSKDDGEGEGGYTVTYKVYGSCDDTSQLKYGGGHFLVDGQEVSMPYTKTIGSVSKGYSCNMNVLVKYTNCSMSCYGQIYVNGKMVDSKSVSQTFKYGSFQNGFTLSYTVK